MNAREDYIRSQNEVQRPSINFTQRDNVRDFARTSNNRQTNPTPSRNIFQKAADSFGGSKLNKSIHKMNPLPGLMGYAIAGGKNILNNQIMHGQNRGYFGGNMLHDKIPQNVRESMMTQKNKDFYDKYMNLANMEQDNEKRDKYLKTANTAIRNAQNTARLNYGLSQIDPEGEYLNKEGLPSYSQDLFGEGQPRFDMDRFKEAMGMGEGILDAIPATERHPDVLDNYAQKTFQGVAPDNYVEDDFGAFYTDADTLAEPYQEPLPFNDNLREAGIASMMGQGPQFGMTNRRYENEYRDYISSAGDMPGGPVTYEEFAQAYERMYQGKPQIGFR